MFAAKLDSGNWFGVKRKNEPASRFEQVAMRMGFTVRDVDAGNELLMRLRVVDSQLRKVSIDGNS